MQGYLPLTGGTMTGIVRFDETADVGVLPDFDFGVQMNSGNVGIVSQAIMHADTPLAADTSMVQHIIKTVGDHKEHHYAGINIKKMNVQGFQEVSFQPRLFVNADPQENYEVATKKYVDQHAGDGEQTYYDASAQMVFKIKLLHKSTGLYTCDCYYIGTATKHITINSGKMSGSLELSHTLNDFLTENGYSFNTPYMNLVSFNSEPSGFILTVFALYGVITLIFGAQARHQYLQILI